MPYLSPIGPRLARALLSSLVFAACAASPNDITVELAPTVISSLDGTLEVTALVTADLDVRENQAVTITVKYTDRNGTNHDITGATGTTDKRGLFTAALTGFTFDGTGTVTAEGAGKTAEATFAVLDRTPPKVTILPPTVNNHVGPGLPLDVQVHVTDEIGISQVTLEGTGGAQGGHTTVIASGSMDETLTFRLDISQLAATGPTIELHALAADLSGNLAAATPVILTVDPAITIATPPGLTGTQLVDGTQQQLADPRSIVASPMDNHLYIADRAQTGACNPSCIWRVDPATGMIDATPVLVGQGSIEGVTVDATGANLYYTDRQNRTGRLTWNGTAYTTPVICNNVQQQRPQDPFHIVFHPTLGIIVPDGNGGDVVRIATCATTTSGTRFNMNGQFDTPRGIALGATTEIYVSDNNRNTISRVDATGTVTPFATSNQPYGIRWVPGTSSWANKLMVASQGDRIVEATDGTASLAAVYLRNPPIDLAFLSGAMYVLTTQNGQNQNRGRVYKVTGF